MTTEIQSIRPTGHHVLVKPIELKMETDSGIILHAGGGTLEKIEKSGRMIGTVIAIGPQAWKAHAVSLSGEYDGETTADWADVGDTVLYARHAGKFIFDPMTGDELYIVVDDDIKAILPPQADWKVDLTNLSI